MEKLVCVQAGSSLYMYQMLQPTRIIMNARNKASVLMNAHQIVYMHSKSNRPTQSLVQTDGPCPIQSSAAKAWDKLMHVGTQQENYELAKQPVCCALLLLNVVSS